MKDHITSLVQLYEATGRPEQADDWNALDLAPIFIPQVKDECEAVISLRSLCSLR